MSIQEFYQKYQTPLILLGIVVIGYALSRYFKSQQANSLRHQQLMRKILNENYSPSYAQMNGDDAVLDDQSVFQLPIGSDQLIGMVYPPALGPKFANFKLPANGEVHGTCGGVAIYGDKVVFNQCQPITH